MMIQNMQWMSGLDWLKQKEIGKEMMDKSFRFNVG